MEYFTYQWWMGLQEGVYEDRHAPYAEHVRRIKDQVPVDLLELQFKLHDALITSMFCNAEDRQLTLCLDGDNEGELLQMRLTYLGLKSLSITPYLEPGMNVAHGLGRVGYDEVDVDGAGGLIHRLLFETGVEAEIRFETFEYEEKEVASGNGR
jgi:hypothetical protein